MKYEREIKTAFKISIPVMMGYGVLGFAFGLLLVSFDYPWYLAPIMSLFIYAGALQFVAINFFLMQKLDLLILQLPLGL